MVAEGDGPADVTAAEVFATRLRGLEAVANVAEKATVTPRVGWLVEKKGVHRLKRGHHTPAVPQGATA